MFSRAHWSIFLAFFIWGSLLQAASAADWSLSENGIGERTTVVGVAAHSLFVTCETGDIVIGYHSRDPQVLALGEKTAVSLVLAFDGAAPSLALQATSTRAKILGDVAIFKVSGLGASAAANLIMKSRKSVTAGVTTQVSSSSPSQLGPTTFPTKGSATTIKAVLQSCRTPSVRWPGPALGLPLSEAKTLTRADNADAKVICSDDPTPAPYGGFTLREFADLTAKGGILCAWYDAATMKPMNTSIASIDVIGATFTFRSATAGSPPVLSQVGATGDPRSYAQARKALVALYGDPKRHEEPKVDTDGSLSDGASDAWYIGSIYQVTLGENLWGEGHLTVTYTDTRFK